MSEYIPSIGLEVHVQLKTKSKMFCACKTYDETEPNTHTCPVCLGYPGALPVMNREAIRKTVMAGLLIGSRINTFSRFDRKNYFYPDTSKNFQISQLDWPLCVGGSVEIDVNGQRKVIRVHHIHQEEDVAKSQHFEESSGIDFNRAGTPLMELVTEPDIGSADEAMAFLQALKQILQYGGISDCNLEEGNIRCDVNTSVRLTGTEKLGVKTEIKNMNTFKGIHRALTYEIQRQIDTVKNGGAIRQETRRWDDAAGMTSSMRSKEYAHDYRYFPEPDLPPIQLSEATIEQWRSELPELPAKRRERFVTEYGLPEYDAGVLIAEKELADYYEQVVQHTQNYKAASNWVMGELLRALGEKQISVSAAAISPAALAELIQLVDQKTINMPGAKEIFQILFEHGGDPEAIMNEKGLAQVSDTGAIEAFAEQVIAEQAKSVEDFKAGKEAALMFLVGQVMKLSRGKANPQLTAELLKKKILG